MRLHRVLLIAWWPLALAGCLTTSNQAKWFNPSPLLRPTADENSALIQYVMIERTAGTDEINRRAWDRVDEQNLSFETRSLLEAAGLRVGIADETAAGALRKLIDDPRTAAGHRARTFALDRPATLNLTEMRPQTEFVVPIAEGRTTTFAKPQAVLGFDVTVRDGGDGKTLVRLLPRVRYQDSSQIVTSDLADRGTSTETFPAAGFEITISASDYLVIGTDDYWPGTFGHTALTGDSDGRTVQRILVIKAGLSKATRANPLPSTPGQKSISLPLVTQANLR